MSHRTPQQLIAEARNRANTAEDAQFGAPAFPVALLREMADELEARTGGDHIDAKHWGLVGRLRARVAQLEAERVSADNVIRAVLEALGSGPEVDPVVKVRAIVAELAQLRRLHEAEPKPNITMTIVEPRCAACGQLGHNCPTGGMLLR